MIIPSTKYPGRVDLSDATNYPQGKARNVTASLDGTGTPLEKDWLNDWFGFQQAVVAAAGITPSNTPDNAVTSQLLTGLKSLMAVAARERPIGVYAITPNVAKNSSQLFPLTLSFQQGGFSVASDVISVPAAGRYRIAFSGQAQSSDATSGLRLKAEIAVNGSPIGLAGTAYRYSTATTDAPSLMAETIYNITTPVSQGISLVSLTANLAFTAGTLATLVVERVG